MSIIRDNTQHYTPAKPAKRGSLLIEYVGCFCFAVAILALMLYGLGALW